LLRDRGGQVIACDWPKGEFPEALFDPPADERSSIEFLTHDRLSSVIGFATQNAFFVREVGLDPDGVRIDIGNHTIRFLEYAPDLDILVAYTSDAVLYTYCASEDTLYSPTWLTEPPLNFCLPCFNAHRQLFVAQGGTLHIVHLNPWADNHMENQIELDFSAIEQRPVAIAATVDRIAMTARWDMVLLFEFDISHISLIRTLCGHGSPTARLMWAGESLVVADDMGQIHMWAIIKKQLKGMRFSDKDELFEAISAAWDSIDTNVVNDLVKSFRARCRVCVELNSASLNAHWKRVAEVGDELANPRPATE
jgi:hypothetical protein